MKSLGKCKICKKEIKEKDEYIDIGYDKNGKYLRRHKKCNPGLPPFMKVRKSRTLEKRHYVKESDKIYKRNKAKKELRKQLDNDQLD